MLTPPSTTPKRTVRLLDSHTVNQIAAGEVVERPSSVVKELVENAIDAGATWIEVILQEFGRKLIEVRDDGCGMDQETALLALQRHATSKIKTIDDLGQVSTLGFRGEALPSIASVSLMTLTTGESDGSRSKIVVEGGTVVERSTCSGPKGTTITVENLFYNTPARLKFLKSDQTELSASIEVVSKAAVANPLVRISFRHGQGILVQTSGSGNLEDVTSEIWGREAVRALAKVESFNGMARVRGFVSPPHFTKPTRSQQWFFVNGRTVKSRTLQAALDQALRSLTPEKRYPLAILMLDIDPERLDVNVSPSKSEVRFHNEGSVFDAVRRAVSETLLATGMVPHAQGLAAANAAVASEPLPFGITTQFGSIPLALAMQAQSPLAENPLPEPVSPGASYLDSLRILGQVDCTFIIAENANSLLIIDQHVAHERICYENLRATRGQASVERQQLVTPETLHLDRRSAEILKERLPELEQIGFQLEPFGGDSFLIRSVPALWRGRAPLQVLKDLSDEFSDGLGQGCLSTLRDDVYIMCACKMAIKAGDPLGMAEMEKLIVDLAGTENPYLCPHGRPITIVMPKSDLYRRFKRC